MDEESSSTAPSAITSALASGTTSPAQTRADVNPKSIGLLEEAVPMVIVQQFIEDNKEKGMPVNQQMADLKRKQDAIKVEKAKITKELKNEERKRSRLRARAKMLSAEDLVSVLALRAQASATKKAKQNGTKSAASANEKKEEGSTE